MLAKNWGIVISAHKLTTKMLVDRSWDRLAADSNDTREEVYNFVRSMARISLLALGFAGKTKYPPFSRDVADLYLMYCLLEGRIAGKESPIEGIRLVKFS
jgi:hypothetical protein